MNSPVTDPALLAQLNAPEPSGAVTDPALLAQLEGGEPDKPYDVVGAVNQFGQGASLGFADEVGTALAATMAKISGEDASWNDIREEMMLSEQDKRTVFQDENPISSLALNVAGGLTTGGLTAAKLIPAGMKTLPKVLANVGIATGEGAIAGGGSADVGERWEGFKQGGMWGGGTRLGLDSAAPVIRKGLDTFSKRRVAQDLVDEAGNFTPINMTQGIGGLQDFYRNIVAPSYGGAAVTRQSKKVLDRSARRATSKQNMANTTRKQLETGIENQKTRMDLEAAADVSNLKQGSTRLQSETTSAVEGTNQELLTKFRQSNQVDAAPVGIPDDELARLNQMSTYDANRELDSFWQKHGFSDAKGRTYEFDADQIVKDATKNLDTPAQRDYIPAIRAEIESMTKADFKPNMLDPDIPFGADKFGVPKRNPKTPDSVGKMDGDSLIQLRNNLRMDASKLGESGEDALRGNAMRDAASAIDSQIRRQLDDNGKALYDADLEAYAVRRSLDEATIKAGKTGGDYDADQWNQGAKKYSPRRSGRGQAPKQGEALALGEQLGQNNSVLKQTIAEVKGKALQDVDTVKGRTAAQKGLLSAQEQPLYGKMVDQQRTADVAGNVRDTMKHRMPQEEPAFWTKTFTTAKLGSPIGVMAMNPFAAYGAGMVFAKGLGTETAQKIISGQTGGQKAMASVLRNYDASKVPSVIDEALRGATRGAITY